MSAGGLATVKVLLQVVGTLHASFAVQVTVVDPPQFEGAPGLLFDKLIGAQPPEAVAPESHVK